MLIKYVDACHAQFVSTMAANKAKEKKAQENELDILY